MKVLAPVGWCWLLKGFSSRQLVKNSGLRCWLEKCWLKQTDPEIKSKWLKIFTNWKNRYTSLSKKSKTVFDFFSIIVYAMVLLIC